MDSLIKYSTLYIITECQFKPLKGKHMKPVYLKAKNVHELELMYVYNIEHIQYIHNSNVTIYRNSQYIIGFITIDGQINTDPKSFPKGCGNSTYDINTILIQQNLYQYPYIMSLLKDKIMKQRRYYNYGSCVRVRDDDFYEYIAITKPGFYINEDISISSSPSGTSFCCRTIHKYFTDLYNIIDISYIHSTAMPYYDYMILKNEGDKRIVSAGTVITNGVNIYPLMKDTEVIYISSVYKESTNFPSLKIESYVISGLPVEYSNDKKWIRIRYHVDCPKNNRNRITIKPLYADSKDKIGYVYDTHISLLSILITDIQIHNYKFSKNRYTDIVFQ